MKSLITISIVIGAMTLNAKNKFIVVVNNMTCSQCVFEVTKYLKHKNQKVAIGYTDSGNTLQNLKLRSHIENQYSEVLNVKIIELENYYYRAYNDSLHPIVLKINNHQDTSAFFYHQIFSYGSFLNFSSFDKLLCK